MNKFYRQFVKLYLNLKYWFFNVFSYRPYLNRERKNISKNNVLITLTSFPPRIGKLYLVIESILDQSVSGYDVKVWLSKEEFPEMVLPRSLERLKNVGVEFKFVSGNIKSYKKLFYAIEEGGYDSYVTADDDAYYPRWWLEGLLNKSNDFIGSAVCYRSKRMAFLGDEVAPYDSWMSDEGLSEEPSLDNFPTGVSGILYPKGCFAKEFGDEDLFVKLAPNADDIWFKVTAVMNKTPCIRVFGHSVDFPKVSGSQKVSLHKTNNKQGQNDVQLKQVLEYFDLKPDNFS